jgi:hypothetical protein
MGKRAQRIPSWPGAITPTKGRIHLRKPTCDIPTFRLRRSGGPYIPVGRLLAANIFNLFFKRGFSEKCYSFPVGFFFHEEGSPLPAKIF